VTLERLPRGRSVTLRVRPSRGLRVLFAAGSDRAVTFAEGTRTRVWDAGTGRLLATLPGAITAAISRDGRHAATIGGDGQAALWSVGRSKRIAALGRAEGVLFSRDGRLVLAAGDDGSAGVWRSATGRQVAALPGFGSLQAGLEGATVVSAFSPGAAFSDDGRLVALANADGNVRIWDVAARKQVGVVGTGWANALAFAPRGGMLAAMTWNGEVVVARSPTSVPLRTGLPPSTCRPDVDPILSGDGTRVLAPTARGAGVWTVDGRRVATLAPPAQPASAGNVGSAAMSTDGSTVAAASAPSFCIVYPGQRHGAAVWRLGGAAPLREVRAGVPVMLDAAGRLLAAGGGLWPAAGGARLRGLGNVLVLSPDGSRALVARDGRVEIARTASGETIAALGDAGRLREELGLDSGRASFSPDGRRLLTPWGVSARLWDGTTGDPIALLGGRDEEVGKVAFGEGGRLALATFSDRAAVFSADDGRLLSSAAGSFAAGALSPDGTLAAVPAADGALEIVDLGAGTRVALRTGTAAHLTDVSFGPTADLIVARDEAGDVHVVQCEICAPEDELLALARTRLSTLARIAATPPPLVATG
jgi:WD40 repeat protein